MRDVWKIVEASPDYIRGNCNSCKQWKLPLPPTVETSMCFHDASTNFMEVNLLPSNSTEISMEVNLLLPTSMEASMEVNLLPWKLVPWKFPWK